MTSGYGSDCGALEGLCWYCLCLSSGVVLEGEGDVVVVVVPETSTWDRKSAISSCFQSLPGPS